MGSTSGATVANVSNIDVFEVGTNIVLLSWNSLRELPHSTNVSQDRGSWLFLPARAWDIILGSDRERARAKKSSSLHSVCLGSLNWNETGSDLLVIGSWAVSWVTDYFFIQFYVSTIFHNDWTPEMKRWKERLCVISIVFNWHSTSVSSTEFNTELNTICTVGLRDSTIRLAIQLYSSAYNSYFQFRLTNSHLQIRLTIGLIILVDQNGWNDPSVRAATLPWSKAGVSCRDLRWRTLAESDARMGRVTRGKDSFWWHFSVDRFPIMDLSPGPTPATLNRNDDEIYV